jgi:FkbM family methyltransferase
MDRIFTPAFSPSSRYVLRDAEEEAYFARHGGAPEAQLIEWARQFIALDEMFVDIGAHIGTWTQDFAPRCKRAHAFEPQRGTWERLVEGIRVAGLKGVTCHNVALGAHQGHIDLSIISEDGGGSTLRHRPELGEVLRTEQVKQLTLDQFEFSNLGLIKIDAEGFEFDILRGATNTLARHRPTLLLEAWTQDWYAEARSKLFDHVKELGYRVTPIQGWPEMSLVEHESRRRAPLVVSQGVAPEAVKADRPLLGLVMIVKNEAARIAKVLASYKPYIDEWTILDTGSTDGTQVLIKQELAGIRGSLHEEPFVDFATSRNRALDLHGTSTVFSIMPNGDVLEGGEDLAAFLQARRSDLDGSYRVRIAPGHYFHPLVMRTGYGWRYKWRTHECAVGPNTGPVIPNVTVFRDRGTRTTEEWRARWTRDIDLLKQDLKDDPTDPRPHFYLGQTYECLDRHADALDMFEKRAKLGGYFDEVYEAKFRIGAMMEKLGRPWGEIQRAYLEALAHDPRRAEPLYALSHYWYDKGVHTVAFMFAAAAAEMPMPSTDLFLDEDVYTWKAADRAAISAFYTGHTKRGRNFAEQALSYRPDDQRMRANRAFYAQGAEDLFGSSNRPIPFVPQEGWQESNPSIYFDGDRLRCIIRTVNYRMEHGRYITPPQDIVQGDGRWKGWQIIRTRNFLIDLDQDLSLIGTVEITDQTGDTRTDYPVHGFEDARLFAVDGSWWATATVCDFTEEGAREIALLRLQEDGKVLRATALRGPWSVHAQKNWMPLIDDEDQVKFIYATSLDGDVGSTVVADLAIENGSYTVKFPANVDYRHGVLRGGSQAVRIDGGWLCVVHDVAFTDARRMYLHRFVFLDETYQLVSMTDLFYFEKLGIEFCAGLAVMGDRLVASYSVNDASARLGIFSLARVRSLLRTDFVI